MDIDTELGSKYLRVLASTVIVEDSDSFVDDTPRRENDVIREVEADEEGGFRETV